MGALVLVIILMALLFIRQNKIRAEHKTVVLEQKLLRLQMNPHFIFNALSNILNFISRKDTTNAATYLTTFSSLLRTTLESSREDYVLLADEIKSIKNYLDLQLLRYENKFTYSMEVDEEIDLESAIIPPMLIQPFIENAIEHGIRHKVGKGHVFVRFRLVDKKIICEVEDDGVGREKAWEAEYQKRKTHKSLATDIITDRIQALNKKLKQKIMLTIIDLKTDADEPMGTRVVLDLPYLLD
jgi:LytS/YehU family sensor histidine kinase